MGKNHFTEEQQEELRLNPYIKRVSSKTITYTKEFKEKFDAEYRKGKFPSQILAEMGIDPHTIGKKRQNGIVERVKQYHERPEGCEDIRSFNSGRPSSREFSDAEKIKMLERKIEYLKQENEFIKKNIQLDREAEWDYARHHQTNTNSSKE